MPQPPDPSNKTGRIREVWIELRTSTERIEGVVRMKADARARRIADVLKQSDRDDSGVLHLVNATVFDTRTNQVKFHKRSLGVNRQQVTYASPIEVPNESKMPWGLPPAEVLAN